MPELDCSQHMFESRRQIQIQQVHAWLNIGCDHARRSISEVEIFGRSSLVDIDLDLSALARHRPEGRHRTLVALVSIPLNFVTKLTAVRIRDALGAKAVEATESCLSVAVASVLPLGTSRARRYP